MTAAWLAIIMFAVFLVVILIGYPVAFSFAWTAIIFFILGLILNVLETKEKVEIVFHGLNPEDPETKIGAFKEIVGGSSSGGGLTYQPGTGGRVPGSSSYFRWIVVSR